MNAVEQMWEAWRLCDASREYANNAGREVPPQEMIEKVFRPPSLMDEERTTREGSQTK